MKPHSKDLCPLDGDANKVTQFTVGAAVNGNGGGFEFREDVKLSGVIVDVDFGGFILLNSVLR